MTYQGIPFARIVLSAVILALLSACGSPSGNEDKASGTKKLEVPSDVDARRSMLTLIDSLEQVVFTHDAREVLEASVLLRDQYNLFARRFPGDQSKSPEFLFKAGALSRSLGEPLDAIRTYEKLLRSFGSDERAPEAQFLIAFTYDEDMRQIELAKEAYNDVILKFPGDHWAKQAKQRLETIDLNDEELIEFFMRKQGE